MLRHLILASALLNLIGCDSELEPKNSAEVKPASTIKKPSSQAEVYISMPVLETISEKSIPPLNLQVTSDMIGTIIDSDEDISEQTTNQTALFRTRSAKGQDRVNMSFELYYDEDETDYLNLEAIEGGKVEIKLIH